jgi:hypothetical protein
MGNISLMQWAAIISNQMGHRFVEMVIRDQRRLVDEGLISASLSPSTNPANDTQLSSRDGRMTELGIKFCEAIRDYQLARAAD